MWRGGGLAVAAALCALRPVTAEAQLPPASVGSAALGHHDVALVRGFGAVAVNPAGLGLGESGTTGTVLPVRAGSGMHPVSLGDVARWQGLPVPDRVREGWLRRIVQEGAQRGVSAMSVTPVAVSREGFALQLSTVGAARVGLNPDAAELLLYGNAGRTGEARPFDLGGSKVDGWVVSTLALAHGRTVGAVGTGRLALGVTAKLVLGHAVVVGRDLGTSLDGDPLEGEVHFPILSNGRHDDLHHGTGVALDLGAAWEGGRLSLGLAVRNLLDTFEWDLSDLVYRPGTVLFDQEDAESDFDERPARSAPGHLRAAALALGFGSAVEAGLAWTVGPDLRLAASGERRWGDDPIPAWRTRAGVGAEWLLHERAPLRAHVGVAGGSMEMGGGASVRLGPVWIGVAGSLRPGGADEGSSGSVGVSWNAR